MKPYYEQDGIVIYHGDCRDVLPTLEPVDLVLTDPPYGISLNTDYKTRGRGALAECNDFPPVHGFAPISVRLWKQKVPRGAERVDFEFVVLVVVAVGIDEHFEVVVAENDRIVFDQRGPQVGLSHIRADVEVGVVPHDLHARFQAGARPHVAFDVHDQPGLVAGVGRAGVEANSDDLK